MKPSGRVEFQVFLQRRKWTAAYFVVVGLSVFYIGPTSFFLYLTEWAIYCDAALFTLLCFAHWYNGDFQRKVYEPPSPLSTKNADELNVLNLNQLPWALWPLIHALYEFVLVINTVVTIAFWCIEGPFMLVGLAFGYPLTLGNFVLVVVIGS